MSSNLSIATDDYWRAYYERRAAILRAEMEDRDEKERVLRLQHEFSRGGGFQVALASLKQADRFYQGWYEEQEQRASLLRANAELRVSLQRAQQYALAAEEANKGLARAAEGWYMLWQDATAAFVCAKEAMESFEQWTLKVEDTSIAPTGF